MLSGRPEPPRAGRTETDSDPAEGAALAGRFVIERELGAGGMATVYLTRDLKHHRSVAMKVLRPELGMALGRERLLREIEIIAHLTHPHILPLHDQAAQHHARVRPRYVTDFGVALLADGISPTHLTETGVSLGTPQYMSLEQVGHARTPACGRVHGPVPPREARRAARRSSGPRA